MYVSARPTGRRAGDRAMRMMIQHATTRDRTRRFSKPYSLASVGRDQAGRAEQQRGLARAVRAR